jgi:broad specificity phosphatase PhoE
VGAAAYLIRHARAGRRSAWQGPDEQRPLSGKGRRQARSIARALRDEPITRIVSSPFVRCVQTVEPLAAALGLAVEEDASLAEGSGIVQIERLTRAIGDGAGIALSSHGDVILGLLGALDAAGVPLEPGVLARKGSTWLLEVDDGRIVRGRYLPPPSEG